MGGRQKDNERNYKNIAYRRQLDLFIDTPHIIIMVQGVKAIKVK